MISWWWLLMAVPSCVLFGFTLMACCAAAGHADMRDKLWALRGEIAKILAFLMWRYPDKLEAIKDDASAVDVAIALLAGHAERAAELEIALARKDAQINNLCARIKLLEGKKTESIQ